MDDVPHTQLEPDELEVFLQDVNHHLQEMEAGILSLEHIADPEVLNATFRAAHTLKAIAGTVGHQPMAELTHAIEAIFDGLREDRLVLTPELTDELLRSVDTLRALRDEVALRQPSGVDIPACLERLKGLHQAAEARCAAGAQAVSIDDRSLTPEQVAEAEAWRQEGLALLDIQVMVDTSTFAPAARLLQAGMAVEAVGHIVVQRPSSEDLLDDRQRGYLRVILATQAEPQEIEQLLGDVSDLTGCTVLPYVPGAGPAELAPPPAPTAETGVGAAAGRPYPAQEGERAARGGERGAAAAGPRQLTPEPDKTVRISVERLDVLMDLVGELVTGRTRLGQIHGALHAHYAKDERVGALNDTIAHLGQVVDQLQDEVMHARMLPVAYLFDRFPRLVRDLARSAGKQVNLIITGEMTELDRSIIEAIGDPLIHLLRNAVDHGIEPPEARAAAGKPPDGAIHLTAEHIEGQVVITVQDDGHGIDPQQIREAAVRRGLLPEDKARNLSDDEAIALIFQPGLSTTAEVTGTSGRGVGLDVVRANVSRLGGSVLAETAPGRGTMFRVTLPLTLAIMQTMMIALGEDTYAIPMTGIVESLYLADVQLNTVKGRPAIRWRDEVLPLVYLREFFPHAERGAQEPTTGKPAIVVVSWGRLQAGLIVDRIIGKQEIVVKPFGPLIGNVAGLSGCTILGDGRMALIVDVPGLIHTVIQTQKRESEP